MDQSPTEHTKRPTTPRADRGRSEADLAQRDGRYRRATAGWVATRMRAGAHRRARERGATAAAG